MKFIKKYMLNDKIEIRILSLTVTLLIVFNSIAIISYYLLPQGFLLGKNSTLDWESSSNILISTMQIFAFNMMAAILVITTSIFPFPRKNPIMSSGCYVIILLFIINGITLGTWSFTSQVALSMEAPSLATRLLRTFDIFHKAGLWEMLGLIFIAGATAKIAVTEVEGKEVFSKSFKKCKFTKKVIIYIVIGLCLMLTGALIESNAIISSL